MSVRAKTQEEIELMKEAGRILAIAFFLCNEISLRHLGYDKVY